MTASYIAVFAAQHLPPSDCLLPRPHSENEIRSNYHISSSHEDLEFSEMRFWSFISTLNPLKKAQRSQMDAALAQRERDAQEQERKNAPAKQRQWEEWGEQSNARGHGRECQESEQQREIGGGGLDATQTREDRTVEGPANVRQR